METPAATSRGWSIGSRLLVVALALALGLVLQQLVSDRLAEIAGLAKHDRTAARAELAGLIRIVVTGGCGLTAALGLWIALVCRNPRAARSFPPPGLLAIGARVNTGPRAQTLTRIGLALGLVLLFASLAAGAFGWYLAAVLEACRA